MIVVDQMRADCLNGALADGIEMPNLRALMQESVTFNQHYTATTPCGPARASLLTGLYAMNHRSVRNGAPLSNAHPTIATEMRKAGYEPMLFGYTDASTDPTGIHPNDPSLKTYEGVAPGFTEIVRLRQDSGSQSWRGELKSKGYEIPLDPTELYRPTPQAQSNNPRISDPALYSAQDSDTAFLTNRTMQELSVRTQADWFAMVSYIKPHPPFVAPAPYNEMYSPDAVPTPDRPHTIVDQKSKHPFYSAFFCEPANHNLFYGFNGHMDALSDEEVAEIRAVYFGLISELDDNLGRLMGSLKDAGQYDDTLIIFTSDHGEMLGDHFQWGKNSFHDPALHVPLIIRDPRNRKTAGITIEEFTQSIDVGATLLQWAGQQIPAGINGQALNPFLEGTRPENWRDYMFAEIDLSDPITPTRYQREFGVTTKQSNYAILREKQFKYVHFNGGLPPLLFDLSADPQEADNLAANPAYAGELQRLSTKMLDHRMTHAHHALSDMQITKNGVESAGQ